MSTSATMDAALAAATTLIHNATGINIEAQADLTFMDGDEWPRVDLTADLVIGEMTPAEFGLMKAMIDARKEAEKIRTQIMGLVMQKMGSMMAGGQGASSMAATLAKLMEQGPVTNIVEKELIDRHAAFDESYALVTNLFYFGLKSRFGRHGDNSIGVRRGGKVTVAKEKA